MKKFAVMMVAVAGLILGMSFSGMAQTSSPDSLLEQIGVTKIESMEVEPTTEQAIHYLNVAVEIENKNDKDLKLVNNSFDFFIETPEPKQKIKIGSDVAYAGKDPATGEYKEIYLKKGEKTQVIFKVEMGRDEASVLETVIHILNFIGKPVDGRKLFINGSFTLGIKSAKGWSYADNLRVEWEFCPKIVEELPVSTCGQ